MINPEIHTRTLTALANSHIRGFADLYRQARNKVGIQLAVITLGTISAPLALKAIPAQYGYIRALSGAITYAGLIASSAKIGESIRERRFAERGYYVTSSTAIEIHEDSLTSPAEMKFNPGVVSYELPASNTAIQVSNGTAIQQESDLLPPIPEIEDIAKSVVNSRLPVLIVGSTGSGKTSVIERIIYQGKTPDTEVHLFDGKPTASREIAGIKKTKYYHTMVYAADVKRYEDEMRTVVNRMADENRGETSPRMIVISDELNNALKKADLYRLEQKELDRESQDKRDYKSFLEAYQGLIISQGREKNCLGIATTHTANVDKLGGDSSERTNNSFLILGSANAFDNIEILLSGNGARLIVNQKTRDRLQAQYEAHKHVLFQGFYALTNINGDWRLVRLPDWSGRSPLADWGTKGEPQDEVRDSEPIEDAPQDQKCELTCPQLPLPDWWIQAKELPDQREIDAVLYLWHIEMMRNKAEIAFRVWGVTKGGSPKWDAANKKVQKILASYG